jgi:hypothetical protein
MGEVALKPELTEVYRLTEGNRMAKLLPDFTEGLDRFQGCWSRE